MGVLRAALPLALVAAAGGGARGDGPGLDLSVYVDDDFEPMVYTREPDDEDEYNFFSGARFAQLGASDGVTEALKEMGLSSGPELQAVEIPAPGDGEMDGAAMEALQAVASRRGPGALSDPGAAFAGLPRPPLGVGRSSHGPQELASGSGLFRSRRRAA